MKTLILENAKKLRLGDVPIPVIGSHEVLVKVMACGICGSDVHGFDGSTGRRIPPIIMGHEAAGIIAAVGQQVLKFSLGDRVTFDSTVNCARCAYCVCGEVNLCESRQVIGVSCGDYRRNGAFAEYIAVPEHVLYALPETFPFEKAALIEAVSIAVHAAKITKITPGSSVAIIGTGMIGLLALQAFRYFGCTRVFAVDLDQERLDLAKSLGANAVFLATEPSLTAKLNQVAGERGLDYAVEVVGTQNSVTTAIDSVRRGGTVTLIGNISPRVEISLQTVVTRQLHLLGSCASAGEYLECVDLMQRGIINVDPLLSAVAPLSEGALWFDRLYRREPGLMKVILKP